MPIRGILHIKYKKLFCLNILIYYLLKIQISVETQKEPRQITRGSDFLQ